MWRGGRRRARASIALATALAAHAIVLVAGASSRVDRAPRPHDVEISILSLAPFDDVQEPAVPQDDRPPIEAHAPPRSVRPRVDRGTIAPSVMTTQTGSSEADAEQRLGEPEVEAPAVRSEATVDLDVSIDPSSVARTMVLTEATGPIDVPQTGTHVGPRIRGERATERRFDDDLRGAAMAKAYVTRRRPIRVAPHPDGTFTYDGSGFDATIRPDGTVVFRDRDDASVDGLQVSTTSELTDVTGAPLDPSRFRLPPIATIGIGGSFDVDSPLTRSRGEDPHRFERERFLEETQELRERLEDEARARELARADRRRRRTRDAGPE